MAADLLPALRRYLVTEGIVRVPGTFGTDPPLWLEPRNGVPAPGDQNVNPIEDHPDVVLGAYIPNGLPRRPYEQNVLRTDFVDFRIRARLAPFAHAIADDLHEALADKRDWLMDDLRIIETLNVRPLGWLASDEQAYDFVMQFSVERYAA